MRRTFLVLAVVSGVFAFARANAAPCAAAFLVCLGLAWLVDRARRWLARRQFSGIVFVLSLSVVIAALFYLAIEGGFLSGGYDLFVVSALGFIVYGVMSSGRAGDSTS